MGQYYNPILLDDQGNVVAHFNSHEYDNGLKLMEHSWLDNEFVAVVEAMLALDGARRVVWAGDYADPEVDAEGNPRKYTWYRDNGDAVEADVTLYGLCVGDPVRVNCKALNSATYTAAVEPNAELPVEVTTDSHPFLLNHDRREYVDKRSVPEDSRYGGAIHPLPLLTSEGNGRGGGDYSGDWKYVGSWARDRISVSAEAPDGWHQLDVSGLTE